MSAAIVVENHPRTIISLALQIIHDDGSLLAALLNCASLCLMDAAIPTRGILSVTSCCLCSESSDAALLDPTFIEEKSSKCQCTVAALSVSRVDEEGVACWNDTVPYFQLIGDVDTACTGKLRHRCMDACVKVKEIFESAMEKKLQRLEL